MVSQRKIDLEMSFFEHLEELRKRLIVVLVVILIAAFVCFNYVDQILFILTRQDVYKRQPDKREASGSNPLRPTSTRGKTQEIGSRKQEVI